MTEGKKIWILAQGISFLATQLWMTYILTVKWPLKRTGVVPMCSIKPTDDLQAQWAANSARAQLFNALQEAMKEMGVKKAVCDPPFWKNEESSQGSTFQRAELLNNRPSGSCHSPVKLYILQQAQQVLCLPTSSRSLELLLTQKKTQALSLKSNNNSVFLVKKNGNTWEYSSMPYGFIFLL